MNWPENNINVLNEVLIKRNNVFLPYDTSNIKINKTTGKLYYMNNYSFKTISIYNRLIGLITMFDTKIIYFQV